MDDYKTALEEIESLINIAAMNPKENHTFESVVELAQEMGNIAINALKNASVTS